MDSKMTSSQTKDISSTETADIDSSCSGSFWNCCRRMQQRYIFIAISLVGSMTHVILSLSMSVTISAMVKSNYGSNSSQNNITDMSDVCPVSTEDEGSSSGADTETGEFDWDELTQSYVLTASNYGALASGLIGARLAEIWSPKMMYGIAQIGSAVCNLFMPLAARWDTSALIALRVIQGIFNGPMLAIFTILLSTWIPPHERTNLGGFYFSATAFGTVLSMFLTGILTSSFGWESVFYIYASFVLIWCVFWFLLVFDSPETHPGISKEERDLIVSSVPKENNVRYPVPWLKILTSPPFWAHIAMSCGNIWILYILLTELPTYLKNILRYDTENTGFVSALPQISTLLGCLSSALLSQWLRKKEYLSHLTCYRVFNAVSTFGPAAALIAVTQMGCDSVSIIVLLVITTGLNSTFIGGSFYNLIDLGINFTGTTHGISWMFSMTVTILSPTIASAIINNNQTVTSWSLVFYITAGVALFPYAIFFLFGSVKEQPWNKPPPDIIEKMDSDKDPEKCT